MAEIRLQARAPGGVLLNPSVMVTQIEWTLSENAFWVLRASGPLAEVDESIFRLDARFEIIRQVAGMPGYVEGNTQFLLRYWEFGEEGSGAETWRIEAYSLDYLLAGRIVDSYASTEEAENPLTKKSGPGDNVIKAIVRENLSTSASLAARQIGELRVDADFGAGESVEKGFAWRRVSDVLREIAEDGEEQGTYLSYGIEASGQGTGFAFHTWSGQRGIDHTRGSAAGEVVVSKAMGNLRQPRISFDHRNEYTAVRCAGAGQGKARRTVRVEDVKRSKASPLAYREDFIENTQAKTTSTLAAEARARLRAARPVRGFAGKLVDAENARYGVVVRFGDLVTVEYRGYSFTCRISRVAGRWTRDGAEELDIDLVGSDVA